MSETPDDGSTGVRGFMKARDKKESHMKGESKIEAWVASRKHEAA
jgi:hypothetical protein